jgi:hypothetical protein
MPQAHDAQPLLVDDDPSKVDWLAIEDESEQASRLAGKKPVVAPTKKRGQTSQGASSNENPEGVSEALLLIGQKRKMRRSRRSPVS